METLRIKRRLTSAKAAIRRRKEAEARLSKLEREFEVAEPIARIREDGDTRRKDHAEHLKRTKRLLLRGQLVAKSGVLKLDRDVLRGALLGAADYKSDPYWRMKWIAEGNALMDSNSEIDSSGRAEDILDEIAADPVTRRRAYNHRLIEAGGIIEETGYGDATPPALLLGILLAIRSKVSDERRIAAWKAVGAKGAVKKSQIEVRFPKPTDRATSAALTRLGLRFDDERVVWHGTANLMEARRIATSAGGRAEAAESSHRSAKNREVDVTSFPDEPISRTAQ